MCRSYHIYLVLQLSSSHQDYLHLRLAIRYYEPHLLYTDYTRMILDHYMDIKNLVKVKQYVGMMLENQHVFKQKNLNYNLVEAIVDLQTGKKLQDLKITQLRHANQRLWLLICIVISLISFNFSAVISRIPSFCSASTL